MEKIDGNKTIGDYVAEDFRTARVFNKYGIDFCCGGKVALNDACREKGVDTATVAREIEESKQEPVDRSQNYSAWSLTFLADYIVNTHHGYLRENTAQIAAYAGKIAEVHGANHPETVEISSIFQKVANDMALHLREEEEVLFPAVKRVEAARTSGTDPERKDVQLLRETLEKLHEEHEAIGDAVHTIRALSKEYAVPQDACNTYLVTYKKLKEFEDDLHKHVHLENNILFPKAGRM